MRRLPLLVDLRDRLVVVVGGGRVAERRVGALLEAGARVVVVAPALSGVLQTLAAEGRLLWRQRPYAPGDLAGATLVIAATSDSGVNALVAGEARAGNALAEVVDDGAGSMCTVPAVVRRGSLTLTVDTGGRAPALAGALRRRLEGDFGEEWSDLVELLSERRRSLPAASDTDAWDLLLGQQVLSALRRGDVGAARDWIESCRSSSPV